jgi:response regulator of citrate/malate metabolism
VEELLESHREELSTEELQQLANEAMAECDDDPDPEEAPLRELTVNILARALQQIQEGLDKLEENDCNVERSGKTIRGIKDLLAPYTELLSNKIKISKQKKIDQYFVTQHHTTEALLPSTSTGKKTSEKLASFFRPQSSTKSSTTVLP